MRKSFSRKIAAMPLATAVWLGLSFVTPASAADSSTLPVISFSSQTGIETSPSEIRSVWSALQTMGTDKYVGGVIGSFKLDESSMIAAAMAIGASELDNFLKSGSLNASTSGIGGVLTSVMSNAAGINLQSVVGSFTSGGGALSQAAAIMTGTGASASGGICDPSVASDLANQGKQKVDNIVNLGLSKEYGFSQMSDMSKGGSSGFASMGCLDKLFQNSGADILFKPPTMSMLTNMLQNWTCPQVPGVAQQIADAFGSGDRFATASLGGFYPLATYGEANGAQAPSLSLKISDIFGSSFSSVKSVSDNEISKMTDLSSLFK
jgi:hypothetical protein